jgi:hypothetical protein
VQALLWKFGVLSSIKENQQTFTDGTPARAVYTLYAETAAGVRAFLADVAAENVSDAVKENTASDVYWDVVESVERVGDIECVDFEVQRQHNFVFDGVVTHNSTLLGNIALSYMCLVSSYKVLYVSPSATQAKTFSNDRLREPIETSPTLKKFTTTALSQNVFEKQFVNRSKITIRYAYLNADRARGVPAYLLALDEMQDILTENIPVIEQCLGHAPKKYKRFIYSGTPKSLDNHLEYYRTHKSTQGEWVVPCDGCNHWNVLGEKNIGRKGLICEKCGKLINPMHPRAQWARMVKDAPWESYRIPQIMVPWVDWENDIFHNYIHYPREKFYNEVLGISFDSGLRPLTTQNVKDACKDYVRIADVENYRTLGATQPIYMGIDWGTAENTYTVVSLSTYVDNKYRVFFVYRFEGEEADPEVQVGKLIELVRYFNVKLIGADYGGGFDRNYKLVKTFGAARVRKYQYVPRSSKGKLTYDSKLGRYKVARTEVMSDIFNAIKRGKCELPRWEEFKTPFAQDMLNIYSEYNEIIHQIQYKHVADKTDDTFHSILYGWLISMLDYPRPDILVPNTEDSQGFNKAQGGSTIHQG